MKNKNKYKRLICHLIILVLNILWSIPIIAASTETPVISEPISIDDNLTNPTNFDESVDDDIDLAESTNTDEPISDDIELTEPSDVNEPTIPLDIDEPTTDNIDLPESPAINEPISNENDLRNAILQAVPGEIIYVTDMRITKELYFDNSIGNNLDITLESFDGSTVTFDVSATGYPAFAFNFVGFSSVKLRFKNVMLDGKGTGRAIRFSKDGGTLNLIDADLRNCYDTTNGGAVHVDWGNATLIDCKFINNVSSSNGGGIFIRCGDCFATNCLFIGNKATYNGGGLYAGGGYSGKTGNGDVTLRNCTFDSNTSGSFGGGLLTSGNIDIKNSTFKNNSALCGGAISSEGRNVLVSNSQFLDNLSIIDDTTTALYTSFGFVCGGGGIYSTTADITILNSTMNNNNTTQIGGAICSSGGITTLTNSKINGNKSSKDGGGIWISDLTKLFIKDTVFSKNQAALGYTWTLDISDNANIHRSNVVRTSYTAPYTNSYNNFDVNYYTDIIYYPVTISYFIDDVNSGKLLDQISFYAAPGLLTKEIISAALGEDWLNSSRPTNEYNSGVLSGNYPIIDTYPVNMFVLYTKDILATTVPEPSVPYEPEPSIPFEPEPSVPSELNPSGPLKAEKPPTPSPGQQFIPNGDGTFDVVDENGTSLNRTLVPGGDGRFELKDDTNGTTLGEWSKDNTGDWIYKDYAPNYLSTNLYIWYLPLAFCLLLWIWFLLFKRRNITRAEFVNMIVNAIQLEEAQIDTIEYEDVQEGSKYYDVIMKAKSENLLKGFTESKFDPDTFVTREEMASILAEVIRYENPSVKAEHMDLENKFNDYDKMNKDFLDSINLVCGLNIMSDEHDFIFDPKGFSKKDKAKTIRDNLLTVLEVD